MNTLTKDKGKAHIPAATLRSAFSHHGAIVTPCRQHPLDNVELNTTPTIKEDHHCIVTELHNNALSASPSHGGVIVNGTPAVTIPSRSLTHTSDLPSPTSSLNSSLSHSKLSSNSTSTFLSTLTSAIILSAATPDNTDDPTTINAPPGRNATTTIKHDRDLPRRRMSDPHPGSSNIEHKYRSRLRLSHRENFDPHSGSSGAKHKHRSRLRLSHRGNFDLHSGSSGAKHKNHSLSSPSMGNNTSTTLTSMTGILASTPTATDVITNMTPTGITGNNTDTAPNNMAGTLASTPTVTGAITSKTLTGITRIFASRSSNDLSIDNGHVPHRTARRSAKSRSSTIRRTASYRFHRAAGRRPSTRFIKLHPSVNANRHPSHDSPSRPSGCTATCRDPQLRAPTGDVAAALVCAGNIDVPSSFAHSTHNTPPFQTLAAPTNTRTGNQQ
jgi:hypothetical protein